jgi:Ca2+-transporting ATPase
MFFGKKWRSMKQISFANLRGVTQSPHGISQSTVLSQRALFGNNSILEVSSNRFVEIIKETLRDPMIWFLIGIGLVFFFIGQRSEGVTLFVAILPLTVMDAFLHWRTQASTLGLKSNLSSRVKVLRDQEEVEIDSRELVPGDLLKISTGLLLPADGVIEEAHEVQIDESVITGEALPVNKVKCIFNPFHRVEEQEVPVDADMLAFAGTRVLTGHGLLRVLFTGVNTAYGEIVQSVAQMPHERTPLQVSIGKLVKNLIYASLGFCLLLAGLRIYQGHGWLDALLSAAALALAAIPEEFPVVFTFFLGVGIYRLAQKHALVRRAVSVENIGRITQICSDKTGTITMGELELTHIVPAERISAETVLFVSALASNPEGTDPVDLAIFKKAQEIKITLPKTIKRFPFTENRKRESAYFQNEMGFVVVTKGSPETIFELSNLSAVEKTQWLEKTSQWAKEGHKVLACAQSKLSPFEFNQGKEAESGFVFIGLLAFEDPPRPEVASAILYAYENKIKVLMLTGDHPETAAAIGREIGLGHGQLKVASAELDSEKFEKEYIGRHPEFLSSLDVVARCTPIQKLKIVNALKAAGEIVAVTGDGVNDVPALKAADIGIAMGQRGTRSAKEVSSIILGDDNFKTIVAAIMEGRQLFSNLKMSFEYLLLIHIPFVLTAALIPLLGYPLLYLPVHIVWLELVIHPTAILAFQDDAKLNSEKSSGEFFKRTEVVRFAVVGCLLAILIGTCFVLSLQENSDVGRARAKVMAILSEWSVAIVIYRTHLRSKYALLVAVLTFLGTLFILQSKRIANTLHVEILNAQDWADVFLIVMALMSTVWLLDNVNKFKSPRIESLPSGKSF